MRKIISLTCQNCNREFRGESDRKFCSIPCANRRTRPQVPINCQECGGEFYVKASLRSTYKYCSQSCYHRRHSAVKFCQWCHKEFRTATHELEQKYCSTDCAAASVRKGRPVDFTCAWCGGAFRRCPTARRYDAKYCTPLCYRAAKRAQFQAAEKPLCPIHGKPLGEKTGTCPACKTREWSRRIRQQVIDHYGGRCTCCGESRSEFLALDHINNDGSEHRRRHYEETGKKLRGVHMYQWVIRAGFPPTLQLLCHNCNVSKGLYGRCPHERERQAVAA